MRLKTFFDKFDELANTPDAVPRMRRFILDLAVQGKLVAQDTKDEPAEILLKRIQAEKARLVESGEIKKQEQLPLVDEDTIPFSLPAGWAASQLGDIAVCLDYMRQPINGTERDLRIAGKAQADLFPYYGATQQQGWIDDFIFDAELVLLGEDGVPFFDALRSKAYLISGKTWVNNHAHVFRGLLISNPFLMHWLNAFDYTGRVVGSTRSKLNQTKAVDIPVALPPLAEQKRIVAKVDELMALCDRLEEQQQEREARHAALARASLARFADAPTPANLPFLFHPSYTIPPADLRKSILTLAVQGKLVPQDPNDGDARETIDRAMAKRQQTIKSKGLRRKELDESADLLEHEDLPSSWCVERFANLVDPENTISYGVLVPGNDVPDGIPFVRAQDLCLSNHPVRPNKTIAPEIEKPYARTRLIGGEILLCVVGSIGKLGVVPDSWAGANIARAVARIKPIPDVFRDYLLLVLQEQSVQNYFTSTTRTLAQPTLNVGMIEQTPIPVPPLAEQRRIVAKVTQLMALVDELEKQLAASRATATNLLSALVAELTI
jgi:type I restriction enzyme, S subunit